MKQLHVDDTTLNDSITARWKPATDEEYTVQVISATQEFEMFGNYKMETPPEYEQNTNNWNMLYSNRGDTLIEGGTLVEAFW